MLTVDLTISILYGDEETACKELGVGRTALYNWKAWGHFPTRLLPKLLSDAAGKNLPLQLCEIPINPKDRAA